VVVVLLGVVAPDVQKSVQGDIATLADAVGKGDKAKVAATAKNLQTTMNGQAAKVAARDFDEASTRKLLGDIVASGDAIGGTGVRGPSRGDGARSPLQCVFQVARQAVGEGGRRRARSDVRHHRGSQEVRRQEVRGRGRPSATRSSSRSGGGGRLSARR
jgi:hypothetical protein